ncbi:MAG: hypothetical protein R3200_01540 [Xanthomonadales bacterium]|nr:hypothetical protein [Xanthomonadales bacterium]
MDWQEWIALLIVVLVAAVAILRRSRRRHDPDCRSCAKVTRCIEDDDVRVLDFKRQLRRESSRETAGHHEASGRPNR